MALTATMFLCWLGDEFFSEVYKVDSQRITWQWINSTRQFDSCGFPCSDTSGMFAFSMDLQGWESSHVTVSEEWSIYGKGWQVSAGFVKHSQPNIHKNETVIILTRADSASSGYGCVKINIHTIGLLSGLSMFGLTERGLFFFSFFEALQLKKEFHQFYLACSPCDPSQWFYPLVLLLSFFFLIGTVFLLLSFLLFL